MTLIRVTSLLLCLLLPAGGVALEDNPVKLRIFSGEPRLIIVNGYSTSFYWWRILQRKIDRYLGPGHPIEVVAAVESRSPIPFWFSLKKQRPRGPWITKLRPALQSKGSRAAIVLAQQSLQGAFDRGIKGIRNIDDWEQISHGTNVLEMFVRALHQEGADMVFLSTHIYKHRKEPEIGNERFALAALLGRNIPHFQEGPDVWDATRRHFPQAFESDMAHPSTLGSEIMAQEWFETLLRYDGLEIPEWSRREMAEAAVTPSEQADDADRPERMIRNSGKPERRRSTDTRSTP